MTQEEFYIQQSISHSMVCADTANRVYNEMCSEIERLSTQHAKMVEMLTKILRWKQYGRDEDFVSEEQIESLLSSIKKGGRDES